LKPPKLGLKENIAWNSSGSLIYLIFQWLITYLVVILLGFTDAGIFTLALSISGIAFAVALYGVRGYQVSDISREYSDKTYVLARTTTSVLALGGALVYLAISAYSLYAALCIVAYLIFKISESYADVYHGIFQRDGRMDIIGKSFILRGVVSNSLAIACMAITHQLLISICVLAFTSWVLIFLYDRNKVGDFYEKSNVTSVRNIFDLLIACAPLAIYALLSSFFMYIPRISLENIMGSETLGIYASIAIPAVIIQVVSGYIFSPLLTIFAEHVSEGNFKLFRKLLIKTFTVIVALSMIVIVGGVIFGEQGLVLLFGEKIREFSYLLVYRLNANCPKRVKGSDSVFCCCGANMPPV